MDTIDAIHTQAGKLQQNDPYDLLTISQDVYALHADGCGQDGYGELAVRQKSTEQPAEKSVMTRVETFRISTDIGR